MIITEIQRKKGGIYAVVANGEPMAELRTQVYEEADDIAVGEEITEERLFELQERSDRQGARTRALEIVARREVCRRMLMQKLSDADYPEDACEYAADEMERCGLMDDRRFAEMYADDMFRVKHFGHRRVAYELTQKGVDRDMAEEFASAMAPDPEDELDALLEGRLGRDALSGDAGERRVSNTLVRYGFGSGDVRAALRRLKNSAEETE